MIFPLFKTSWQIILDFSVVYIYSVAQLDNKA